MSLDDLALFRAHPGLERQLPRTAFVRLPTAIEPLAIDGVPAHTLFVKRDDLCCPLYGGNKPRKLEFLIGDALARGAHTLVTTGGLGTNHGLATTILGREVGLRTVLVLVRQPITPAVRETLLLHASYGARHVYGANVAGTAIQTLRVLAAAMLRGERPYLIPTGGSSARGNLGLVSAGFELAEQVRAGVAPEPERVFVAVGTGGTLAGLVLGMRLAGLRTRVVGVLVNDILPPSPGSLARVARASWRLLRRFEPDLPEVALEPADFELARDQLGAGYGAPTPAACAAVEAAAASGLRLETTYTGKCLAAIRQRAKDGSLGGGPVLFWNTYNGVDPLRHAPRRATEAELPSSIRRVLAGSAAREATHALSAATEDGR